MDIPNFATIVFLEFLSLCLVTQVLYAAHISDKLKGKHSYGVHNAVDISEEKFINYSWSSPLLTDKNYDVSILLQHNTSYIRAKREAVVSLPLKVDWREKGVLTEVKDQKNCGACWAFSVLETIEAMYAVKTGKSINLSVQQLIDCSAEGHQCNGGDTCLTLKWLVNGHIKVMPEKTYPTTLVNKKCEVEYPFNGVPVSNFKCQDLTANEEEILKLIANHGPVIVAVNSRTWHDYLGGIIQYHCDGRVDHAVQLVGYDLTGEVPYYIVRNSWGSNFGHKGYLYLKIGGNICGVAQEVVSLSI